MGTAQKQTHKKPVSYCSIVLTHYAFSFPKIQPVNCTGKKGLSSSFYPPNAAVYHMNLLLATLWEKTPDGQKWVLKHLWTQSV